MTTITEDNKSSEMSKSTDAIKIINKGVIGGADVRCLPLAPRSRSLH